MRPCRARPGADRALEEIADPAGAGVRRRARGGDRRSCTATGWSGSSRALSRRRRRRERLAGDGVVASLLLDPRPVPGGPARRACARRSTRSARTWSPTAATSSCSGSTTASRGCGCTGSCDGCAASAATLELAIEGALRGGRAGPRGHRRRGRRRAPPPRAAAGAATSEWVALDGAAEHAARRARVGHARGLVVANVAGTLLAYRNACAGCGRALDEARCCSAARSRAPACGAALRPAARRAQRRRRRAAARPRAAAAQRRRGRVALSVTRSPPAAAPPRTAGAHRASRALRAVPVRHRRGPPPPAAPRRAADRLRLRDVLVDALGRRRVPARRRADAVARATSSCPTSCGRRSRSRSAWRSCMRSSVTGTVVALYPSPAGATESELDLDGVGRAVRRQPGARAARARRRGADRQPARATRRATRSRRSTSATGSSG